MTRNSTHVLSLSSVGQKSDTDLSQFFCWGQGGDPFLEAWGGEYFFAFSSF